MSFDDFLKLLNSLSVVVGIGVAIFGFWKWRAELFAKRRIELCEDVLTRIYEIRDSIDAIREPVVLGGEGSSRPKVEGETEQQRQRAEQAYVYYERFDKRREPFTELNGLRYRFMAIYGTEWATPFQTFVRIVNRIVMTAGARLRLRDDRQYYGPDAARQAERDFERQERYDKILYKGYDDNDPIDQEIAIAIDQLETKCREEIRASSSLWYGIQKYVSKASGA